MAICNANYCFTFVDVGACGKFSDSSVLKNGKFFEKLENETLSIPQPKPLPGDNENGPLPYVILADEAFGVSKTILRPYARSNLNYKKKFLITVYHGLEGILNLVLEFYATNGGFFIDR